MESCSKVGLSELSQMFQSKKVPFSERDKHFYAEKNEKEKYQV